MKLCTDISQSKALAEILTVESADMNYWCGCEIRIGGYTTMEADLDIPAWSLDALFNVMPKTLEYGRPILGTNYEGFYFVQYRDASMGYVNGTSCYDNPIDACVEMILKLHKEGVL